MQFLQQKRSLVLLPTSGVLMGLCLVFTKIAFFQWLVMVPALLWLFCAACGERRPKLRHLYGAGFLYFISFYLVVFHWFFYLYPMEFAGVTPAEAMVLVLICWICLSLLQASLFSLIFPIFGLLCRTRVIKARPVLIPFLFAVQYVVAEWSQTLTWMGVPWARLPLGQIDMGPFVGSAALFGSYFLTLCLVCVNALVAYAILHRERLRFCAAFAAGTLLLSLGTGLIGLAINDVEAGEPIVVAAVQGNVGSTQKWSSGSTKLTKEIYERYTAEAAAAGATLVVFPETFLPNTITESTPTGIYVRSLAIRYNVTIMCGAFDNDAEGERNAIFTVYPDGTIDETVYAKRRLVPFGEFVPWRPFIEFVLPPLADMGMLSVELLPGTDSAIVETPFGAVGGLLCFDSIYELLTLESVRDGAELLVLPTNDSWFTDSAAVYMHSSQARLRAIESGRWIVRSADTGISSIIDPDGNTHDLTPPLVEGMSVATARVSTARTLYSYIGNLLVYLMIAALAALSLSEPMHRFLQRRKEKHTA